MYMLTSCLSGLDSAALLMFSQQQIYLFGQIQTSQTVVQVYSDTSPYEVNDCSLFVLISRTFVLQIQTTAAQISLVNLFKKIRRRNGLCKIAKILQPNKSKIKMRFSILDLCHFPDSSRTLIFRSLKLPPT